MATPRRVTAPFAPAAHDAPANSNAEGCWTLQSGRRSTFLTCLLRAATSAVAFAFALLICNPALSQSKDLSTTDYRFKTAFEVGGEPSFALIQDRDGFIWIGSLSSGLVRFDGQEARIYKEGAQRLASNYVTHLFEDSRGLIWIGTNSGLNVYDKSTDKFSAYFHDPKNPRSLANDSFILNTAQIAEDKQGRMWFGTRGGPARPTAISLAGDLGRRPGAL